MKQDCWSGRAVLVVLTAVGGASLGCDGSPSPEPEPPGLRPPAPGAGFQVGMSSMAPAGRELWRCLVMDGLPVDDSFVYINSGESLQNPFVHHMDLMALALTGVDFAPGEYDCSELYGEHSEALMDKGIILYASQIERDTISLPAGVAAAVPARSLFMYEIHYVNTTDQDVMVHSAINAYTLAAEQVTETIFGGPVRDRYINVPAGARDHIEWSRCVMNEPVDLVFVSSHTHELAERFEIRYFDGSEIDDEVLYRNDDWQSPYLRNFDPPLRLDRGQGLEFRCYYRSDRDTATHWGFSAQDEMCQAGVVFTPGRTTAKCEVVQTSDGVIMP
jgi:hypothetical protein